MDRRDVLLITYVCVSSRFRSIRVKLESSVGKECPALRRLHALWLGASRVRKRREHYKEEEGEKQEED